MIAPGYCIGGKYEVQRLLGEGGMGQVFEARNLNTGRRGDIQGAAARVHPPQGSAGN